MDNVLLVVTEWLGDNYELLHWWVRYETYYIVCRMDMNLYFLRVFPIAGELQISQDRVCYA